MRSYTTVRDILRQVSHWHRELLDHCCEGDAADADEAFRPLAEYLTIHERSLQRVLDQDGTQEQDTVLNTWLQYVPAEEVEKVINRWKLKEHPAAEEVTALVLEFDDALIEFYKSLANQAQAPPRINEVFQNLLEAEEWQRLRNAWSIRDSDSFHTGRG